MRVKQPMFYRHAGVRQRQQLAQPRLVPMERLVLPFQTIYHYLPNDTVSTGPSAQDPLFTNVNGRVFIEHVTELTHHEGSPRRTVVNPMMLQNEYRRKTRLFKPLRKDAALLLNTRNVLVVNHAMLSALYRYIPSFKAEYFRWLNVARTFWDRVQSTHERFPDWHHYLELHLPETIPTYEQFRRLESTVNQKTLEAFSTPAALHLMDLWQWFGDQRESSSLATLSDAAIRKTNLLVRIKGYFFVINLGVIDEFRKDPDEDGDSGVAGTVLQRQFLRLLHGLRDVLSGATDPSAPAQDTTETPTAEVPAPTKTASTPPQATRQLPPASSSAPATGTRPSSVDEPELEPLDGWLLPDPVSPPEAPSITTLPTDTTEPSERTDVPTLPAEEQGSLLMESDPPSMEERLTNGILGRAWEYHEAGLLSPGAYRRAVEDANTYKDLPDPYGSGRPLSEMLTISQEELALPEVDTVPDRDTIPDKSMLKSKLKAVQRGYLKNVLHKDVVSAVMGIQQQGIAVKDYRTEVVRDAMNHYEIHTVTLKPVRGRQSTVRFRLPVVDEDGVFTSNGVRYKMRLQRADVPLRKVNPSRVAMTSYYNKTFVDRSSRATNNYDRWLTREIVNRGMDPESTQITDLRLSNVFDATLQLPRIYTLLAKRASGFRSGPYLFSTHYATRAKTFGAYGIVPEEVETDQHILIGVYQDKHPVLVDFNNTLYVKQGEDLEVLGTLPELLGIETVKAPIEMAEMSVANKQLPVGLVLGYAMGLSQLIAGLGCDVSRFRRGERIPVQRDEYTLTFQDEVLVLSKLDRRSTLILAGLNRYHATLRRYSVWDFDRKDVYFRLLSDTGLGIRYLREIDSLLASWVDPITLGLLEEMGEPTEFLPLVIRATELLMTDHSPEEVDGAYMRYRGYERFAGMVYGELTRAAKLFNARVGVGENAVELNPHQVWQKVVQDPSVGAVEESNPLQNLREQEAMTYRGDGGRGGKSMVERTRIYHDSDVGVVSESTVDSGDVGVVAYLTPDANFTNLRGVTRRFNPETDGNARLLSSSALNAPCADHDDPKRISLLVPFGGNPDRKLP